MTSKHPYELELIARDNGWSCDGRTFPGGCVKRCTGMNQTAGWKRYRSVERGTDFDLCEGCVKKYEVAEASPSSLPTCARIAKHDSHVLALSNDRNGGWECDGCSLPGGCVRGLTGYDKTAGLKQYRCTAGCDFDLCQGCFFKNLPLVRFSDVFNFFFL